MIKYLIGIIVIMGIALAGIYSSWRKELANAKRWQSNSEQVENYYKGELSQMKLDKQEFERSMADSTKRLLDSLNIKPKTITEYVTIHHYSVDTVYVQLDLSKLDDNTYSFIDENNCFKITGVVKSKDPDVSVGISSKEYKNTEQYFIYQDRESWWEPFGIKIKIFGNKFTDLKIVNDCGESQVRRIEVIKN